MVPLIARADYLPEVGWLFGASSPWPEKWNRDINALRHVAALPLPTSLLDHRHQWVQCKARGPGRGKPCRAPPAKRAYSPAKLPSTATLFYSCSWRLLTTLSGCPLAVAMPPPLYLRNVCRSIYGSVLFLLVFVTAISAITFPVGEPGGARRARPLVGRQQPRGLVGRWQTGRVNQGGSRNKARRPPSLACATRSGGCGSRTAPDEDTHSVAAARH